MIKQKFPDNPLVSVVIPCYNQGEYLIDAISSVQKQSYKHIEIIVVNDGSTDVKTLQILNNLDKSVTLIETSNNGLSSARNAGIATSTGQFIMPLDADDVIGASYLERAVKAITESTDIGIVYCEAEYFGATEGKWILPEFTIEGMLLRNLIFCSALFRKADFDAVGGYSKEMKYGWEDWDLWLRMLKNGVHVYKIPDVLFFYRQHGDSMVRNIEEQRDRRQYLEQTLLRRNLDFYLEHFPEPITIFRNYASMKDGYDKLEMWKREIYNSASYCLGSFLLSPLKWFKRIGGNNKNA